MNVFVALVCVTGVTGILKLQHFVLHKQYSEGFFVLLQGVT